MPWIGLGSLVCFGWIIVDYIHEEVRQIKTEKQIVKKWVAQKEMRQT